MVSFLYLSLVIFDKNIFIGLVGWFFKSILILVPSLGQSRAAISEFSLTPNLEYFIPNFLSLDSNFLKSLNIASAVKISNRSYTNKNLFP